MIIRLGVRVKDQRVSDADSLILPRWTVFLMWFLCAIKYFLKPHVRSQARWADRGLRWEVWTVWGSESIRSRFLVRGRSLRSRNPRNAGFRWNGPAGELAWESAGCGSRAFGGSTCGALIGMGEQLGMGRGRRGMPTDGGFWFRFPTSRWRLTESSSCAERGSPLPRSHAD